MTKTCKNCNNHFKGNFCNNCGQTAETHEINFKSIIHEIQHSILHVDKGILFTTKELFRRPGHTIREYIQGKRVKHFKPFAYIFILSTAYALLTKLSNKSNFLGEFLYGMKKAASYSPDAGIGFFGDVVEWMANHYAYSTLILIPIISLSSYLCFYKTRENYFKHLILNSFVAGQRTVAFLVILPFVSFITDKNINEAIDIFKIFLGIAFTFWSYYQFFDATKPFKRILLTLLTYIVMGISFFIIAILVTIVGFVLKM